MPKVIINPGHGPGNVNKGPTGYYEYQGMWKLANYLKAELEKRGVIVALTRAENENPSITARGEKAQGYDVYISEHSNAYNGTVRGCDVYHSLRRDDKVHAAPLSLAAATLMGNNDRGAKTKPYSTTQTGLDYYGEIRAAAATNCPHIFMCESGFHDNVTDEAWLMQDDNLRGLAKAQAVEIFKILGVAEVLIGNVIHIVAPGETLYSIGKQYNVSHLVIQAINGIADPNSIAIGTKLIIHANVTAPTTDSEIDRLAKELTLANARADGLQIALNTANMSLAKYIDTHNRAKLAADNLVAALKL